MATKNETKTAGHVLACWYLDRALAPDELAVDSAEAAKRGLAGYVDRSPLPSGARWVEPADVGDTGRRS